MAMSAPMAVILPFSTRMTWSLALVPCAGSMTAPARIATTCAESGADRNRTSKANKFLIAPLCPIVPPLTILPEDETRSIHGVGKSSGRGRPGKDVFRQQRVHTDVAVDQLRDVDVHGDAREHVGFIAAQMLFLHEEFDH